MERLLAAVAIAILGWIEQRAARRSTAVDADVDRGALRRAGDRLREWMQQDRARSGGEPDQDRS